MSGMASRSRPTSSRYSSRVWRRRIAAEHARRAGLHRQVQVPADLRQVAHRRDHPRRDVARMRAGEADPLEPGDLVEPLEQRREVARRVVGRLVVVDDLPEQLDFAARPVSAAWRASARMSATGRIRSWPRVYGTTQKAQNSLQPSMMVT